MPTSKCGCVNKTMFWPVPSTGVTFLSVAGPLSCALTKSTKSFSCRSKAGKQRFQVGAPALLSLGGADVSL